jgi:hypothetical protein
MNKDNQALLQALHYADSVRRFPSLPDHARVIKKYKDNSANALTKCIIDFLTFSGFQAERINTTGRMIDNTKQFTDVVGFRRQIGGKKWIKGTGTKGSADISATIKGRSVKIEVKLQRIGRAKHKKSIKRRLKEQAERM